ncbi:zinc-finger homeodomain protein 1-like [Andrographis paniculata]|uniref:zinc-finger homeodomain protein 1-like n=1 Tax=Andrographis paniculata TaxID=175694 RepID=UPI0021E976A3|nr:zinc-finger homeodomain protein 1-like [Andrographis paniculata]
MEYEDQHEGAGEGGLGPTFSDPPPHQPPAAAAAAAADSEAPQRRPKYRECQKNHAVGLGGYAVDGCGEFMPAGEEGTIEFLKCAACNCHRNFHRKESADAPAAAPPPPYPLLNPHGHFGYRGPSGYLQVAAPPPGVQRATPPPLALPSSSGGGGAASGSRDYNEMEDYYYSNPNGGGGGKSKRFRTKFTQEQKDKMLSLATRLDWKIQKQNEEMVQQFCVEIGVKRHVFKVWMHNNKNTLGKKLQL